MAVTIDTAEQAMKIVYLDVITDQLNNETDPLYNKIQSSSRFVTGKEVVKMAGYGVNGGVGAGSESGALPTAAGNNYIQFKSVTKNLYGVFSISDKSIKASSNDAGSFVRLLDGEIKGVLKASKFNNSRMLHTDGTGKLTLFEANAAPGVILNVVSTKYLIEGLLIDIMATNNTVTTAARRIVNVDRINDTITISGANVTTINTDYICLQGSYNLELTGMAEIFKTSGLLYGVERSTHSWMQPYMQSDIGAITDVKIQTGIDYMDEIMGSEVDYLLASSGVVRSYQEYLEATKRNVNTLELKGGFTSIGYGKIPFVHSRFATVGTLKLLDTSEFMFHHMGDWEWMAGQNGKILSQVAGYPTWTATLVKYVELVCDHPGGQAELSGVTES